MQSPAQMSHSFFGATVAVISYNPDAAKPNLYAILPTDLIEEKLFWKGVYHI